MNIKHKALFIAKTIIIPDIIDLKEELCIKEIKFKNFDVKIDENNNITADFGHGYNLLVTRDNIQEFTVSDSNIDIFLTNLMIIQKDLKEKLDFYNQFIKYETTYKKKLLTEKIKK